jgi:hypothetical protein
MPVISDRALFRDVFSALVHCGMATKLRGSGEDAPPLCSPIPSRVLAAYPSHGAVL